MLKATKDIYVDANNKIVPEPSTTGGTFKVAAEGGVLSEQDAARYGINGDNYGEHGLEPFIVPQTGVGTTIDNSALQGGQTSNLGSAPKANVTDVSKVSGPLPQTVPTLTTGATPVAEMAGSEPAKPGESTAPSAKTTSKENPSLVSKTATDDASGDGK